MTQRLFFLTGLFLVLLNGCTSVEPFPSDWSPPVIQTASTYKPPVGLFANHGESNTKDFPPPTLSAILFNKRLEGFDIDNVRFSESGDGQQLLVKPLVGSIGLEAELVLISGRDEGHPDRWLLKSSKDYADGYVATESLFYTGGAFLPLAAWKNFSFQLADDGALLIHIKDRALVNLFYFFPVTMTDELWLKYPVFIPTSSASEEGLSPEGVVQ